MKKAISLFIMLAATLLAGASLAADQYVRVISSLSGVEIKGGYTATTGSGPSSCYQVAVIAGNWTVTVPEGYRLDGWYTMANDSASTTPVGPDDCGKLITQSAMIAKEQMLAAKKSSGWKRDGTNPDPVVCLKFVKVWNVTATVSPKQGGTVSGTGTVDDGATVTLTATPNDGYAFDHWDGLGETSATLTSDPITKATTFVAVFRELKVDKPTVTKSFTYDGNAKTCATAGDHYTVSDNVKTAAGTYTFTATLKDGYHWSDGTSDPYTVEWTIGKAENGFTDGPAITGWKYDGSPSSPTATAKFSGSSGISYVYYDGAKVKLSCRPSDAGNYYLKATTPGSDNYASVTSDFVSFSIAPREINTSTISFEDKTETYDGTAKKIVVGYVPDHVTATYSNNSRTDAGSQTATVTFAPENGNYTVSVESRTATLTIDQATISSLALVASSVTYDGQPHPPIVMSVSTANGKTFMDDAVGWTVSYDRDDFVNAGEIKVSVTGNKNLTGTPYYPQTYTINRARTAEMSVSPVSMIYNGQPCEPVLTLTNCAEDPDSDSIATEPGTYYVRATPDANHAWSDGSTSSKSVAWTIDYQQVTVTYDLNYDDAPAPSTRTLNYAKEYTFPAASRTGYDFKGWWTDPEGGTEVTESTKVATKSAHSLYAHWKAKEYTLTITMETGHEDVRYEGEKCPYVLTAPLVYDATNLNELAVVSKEGYRFKGYYSSTGAQLYDANGHCVKDALSQYWDADWPDGAYRHAGNLTVVARFGDPLVMCDVTTAVSPASAGTVTGGGTYEKGSNAVLVATATNPGYSFAYWNRTNDNVQVSTDKTYSFTVSESAGYVAVFTGNVYTVTFMGMEGTPMMQVENQTFGSKWKLPTATRDGYTLDGWYTLPMGMDEKLAADKTFDQVPTGPLFVYANWKEITDFTVTFVDPEELPNRQNPSIDVPMTKGETVSAPPSGTGAWHTKWNEEYWIAGWNPPLPQEVSSNMTITAVRESIATVLDCESLKDAGWVFQCHSNWTVCTTERKEGNSCLRLERPGLGSVDTVRVTLPKGGGTLSFYWMGTSGEKLNVLIIEDDSDKAFDEFRPEADGTWKYEEREIISDKKVTITFSYISTAEFGHPFYLDTFSWTAETKPRQIDVTSDGRGTVQPASGAHDVGSKLTLTATAEPGYAFCCWTNDTGFATNENPWTFTVTENASYQATFTNAQYVVTLDPNGGTGGDASVIVTYDKPLPTLEQAQRPKRTDGWTFNGYTNAAGVDYYDADGESAKDWDQPNAATLFAQWKAPDEYALTVKVDGRGSVLKKPDASQYVANTQVELEARPETGAVFAQWSDGVESPTRAVTMTENISLTATFTNRQYVVTFDPNGGSVTPTTKIVTYGETYGDLPTPERNGYTFRGWFTQTSGGNKVEATTTVTTDADRQKLFAQWDREVGELSKALDCSNLDFAASGGWAVFTNETFAKEGISCLSNSVPEATLTASLPTAGTLTFWWKGAATDDEGVQLKVKVAEQEMAACMIRKSEQDDKNDKWSCVTIDVDSAKFPVNVSWTCTSAGAYCAVDFVTWTPDAPAHPEPTDEDKVTISAAGVKDGKFTLSFASDERFDYNLLTNANLLIDSWGKMEKKTGTGSALVFEPEIIDGLPQLFYKVETIQRQD